MLCVGMWGQKATVSGYIRDAVTGETLIGAAVLADGTGLGAVSNEFGFYTLTLESGQKTLEYSYLGYGTVRMEVPFMRDTTLNVMLPPRSPHLRTPDSGHRLLALWTFPRVSSRMLLRCSVSPMSSRSCRPCPVYSQEWQGFQPCMSGEVLRTRTSSCWTALLCTMSTTCWASSRYSLPRRSRKSHSTRERILPVMEAGSPVS